MKTERTLAIALETVGLCVVALGIGVEVATKADLGYILVTSGAWVATFGTFIFAKLIRKG